MSLEAQTDAGNTGTQSTWVPQGPWKNYRRFSDDALVEARLLPQHHLYLPKGPLMEVRESKVGDDLLSPVVFHDRYRPVDD